VMVTAANGDRSTIFGDGDCGQWRSLYHFW
jgi:hypothetical protein